MKEIYVKNYKTLIKDIKENVKKMERYSMLHVWKIIFKMAILHKAIYRFNAIPI